MQELGTSEMSNWLREHGIIAPKTENVTHLPGHLVLEGLRNGHGVSLTTRAVVEDEIAGGRLQVLFEEPDRDLGYFIVTRPGVRRPPLRAFVRWLRRHARPGPQPPREAGAVRTETAP